MASRRAPLSFPSSHGDSQPTVCTGLTRRESKYAMRSGASPPTPPSYSPKTAQDAGTSSINPCASTLADGNRPRTSKPSPSLPPTRRGPRQTRATSGDPRSLARRLVEIQRQPVPHTTPETPRDNAPPPP